MENKDAKKGMTIKKVESKPYHIIPVGEKIKILEVEGNPTIDGAWCKRDNGEKIKVQLCYFEPTPKFQIGDKVVYHSDAMGNINGEVVAYEPRVEGYPYVICIEARDGYGVTTANEKEISYKKGKSELEKGDKFLTIHEAEGECTVLCRSTNSFGKVEYYYKDKKGGTDIVSVDYIKEVVV